MNILTRYQNFIFIGIALIVAFGLYAYFFTGDEEPVLKEEAVATLKNPVDQELIALLLELRGITLDESIFADPVFASLTDFSPALVPEPTGRVNPLAPMVTGSP